jgi:O-antigen ligase
MSIAEAVQYSVLFFSAFLLAVVLVATVVLFTDVNARLRYSWFPYLFPLIGVVMVWGPLSSMRNLSLVVPAFDAALEDIGTAAWVSRAVVAFALLICAARILSVVTSATRQWPRGVPLFAALLVLLVTHYVTAASLGEKPGFSPYYLYPFVLFTAAFVSAGEDVERSIRFAKVTLFVFLLGGALLVLLRPEAVVQSGYRSLLPGVSIRYWGLGVHANSLGALAVLFLLCVYHQPFKHRALQWFGAALGVASLVFAQSKTMWVAASVALLTVWIARLLPRLRRDWTEGRLTAGMAAVCSVPVVVAVGLWVIFQITTPEAIFRHTIDYASGAKMTTLTGRDRIWALALEDWRRNLLFGYGPTWGELDYRLAVGIPSATHAHNQLIHSAASAGVFGLFASIAFLLTLSVYAVVAFRQSAGLTGALVAVILVQSITEVPLLLRGFGTAGMFWQLLTFVVVIGYNTSGSKSPKGAVAV